MARGGARPNSGPMKGTKYRPRMKRAKKKNAKKDLKPKQKAEASISVKNDEKPKDGVNDESLSPLEWMLKTMNDTNVDIETRARLAIAVAPFVHEKADNSRKGKKDEKEEKAKAAAGGRFGPSAPPKGLTRVK